MTIALVGSITSDILFCSGLSPQRSLGGILYNAIALSSLSNDTIKLFANVGRDIEQPLRDHLDLIASIDRSHIDACSERNVSCYLFQDGDVTGELHRNYPAELRFRQLVPALESEGMLMTFPTGYELSLRTLARIRSQYRGLLFLDYHTLSLSSDKEGVRFWRKRANWIDWVSGADIVQFNRNEAESLAGTEVRSGGDLRQFFQKIFERGAKIVLVTLGKHGCLIAEYKAAGIGLRQYEGVSVSTLRSTIGCGDVFAGAFLATYLRTQSVDESCTLAVKAAALKCSSIGILDLSESLSRLRL